MFVAVTSRAECCWWWQLNVVLKWRDLVCPSPQDDEEKWADLLVMALVLESIQVEENLQQTNSISKERWTMLQHPQVVAGKEWQESE